MYTKEQKEFIAEIVKGRTTEEITRMVNNKFNLNLSNKQIRSYKKNHGLKSGVDCTFKKGHVPFNKGKKGLTPGGEATQFKNGNVPHNYRSVGSERVNADGYREVKIADPNKWEAKHILLWEKENGPVPDDHVIIFGDSDKTNLDINNLILVSRKQLLMLNRNDLIKNDAEFTRTGILIADLYSKISERKRGEQK